MLAAGRFLTEDGADASHIEFAGAVIEVDTVLLLLHVGQLCVAVSPYVVCYLHERIHLTFQTGVELLQRVRRLTIAP